LRKIGAGCHVPVGALGKRNGSEITLHGELFDDDGVRCAQGVETGTDTTTVGQQLAIRLMADLASNA
jgi:porphobilinogen deaminase